MWRVNQLSDIYKPKKTTFATVTYTDIGGIDKGIGDGLSGQLRNELSQVDGFVHVVRVFESDTVPHPYNSVDPKRDVEMLDSEFLLVDLITVENRLQRLDDEIKKGKVADKRLNTVETELMNRLKAHLEQDLPLRDLDLTADEKKMLRGYGLLSLKPIVMVLNLGETWQEPTEILTYDHQNSVLIALQGQIEAEIAQLEGEDREMFLEEYGIKEPSSRRVIQSSYNLMRIHSFFTVGEDEVRAWSVPIGATAPEAAGTIHSDLQRGFIRAEVTPYDDFMACGGDMPTVKSKGKMRVEGKTYVVQDGDILTIRFNV